MPALTARDSSRYGVRLFGYLLVTTLLSALVAGGGIGIAYTLDADVLSSGSLPGTTALAVAAVGVALGGLVFLAGVLTILFTLATDAVHAGVNRPVAADAEESTDTERADVEESEQESTDRDTDEATTDRSGDDRSGEATSETGERSEPSDPLGSSEPPAEESASDPLGGGDDGGDAFDPSEPIDDPHSAQSDPFGTEAGPAEEEAWREEIEQKLEEEDTAGESRR